MNKEMALGEEIEVLEAQAAELEMAGNWPSMVAYLRGELGWLYEELEAFESAEVEIEVAPALPASAAVRMALMD